MSFASVEAASLLGPFRIAFARCTAGRFVLPTVLVGYASTFRAEVAERAVEEDIFPERALERTVVERYLDGRLEADPVEMFILIAQYPDMPACEILLQSRSERRIEHVDVVGTQTFAIRGICDHHTFGGVLRPFIEGTSRQLDHLLDTGRLYILACDSDCVSVDVATVDLICEILFLAIVIIEAFEQFGIEVGPFFKGKALAEDSRVDVGRDERRFDQQCSGTAHGIREITVSAPSGLHDDSGREHLVQRSGRVVNLITALRQRFATRIERDCHPVFRYVDIEQKVGSVESD